jgi:ribosomal protein S18 acetylase RimI-like enzyme
VQAMQLIKPPLRRGTVEDIHILSEFVEIASEGLAMHLWSKIAATSEALPSVLVPLQELVNMARDTWYVHVLAAYPEYRGRGQGTTLLRIADGLAESAGKNRMSLIVSDTNVNARRVYERCGYIEVARRWMVKEEWQHPGVAWLLLVKKKY